MIIQRGVCVYAREGCLGSLAVPLCISAVFLVRLFQPLFAFRVESLIALGKTVSWSWRKLPLCVFGSLGCRSWCSYSSLKLIHKPSLAQIGHQSLCVGGKPSQIHPLFSAHLPTHTFLVIRTQWKTAVDRLGFFPHGTLDSWCSLLFTGKTKVPVLCFQTETVHHFLHLDVFSEPAELLKDSRASHPVNLHHLYLVFGSCWDFKFVLLKAK